MYLKETGSKIYLMRQVYDPAKKRGTDKIVVKIPRWSKSLDDLDPKTKELLTSDEIEAVNAKLVERRKQQDFEYAQINAKHIAHNIRGAAEGLLNPDVELSEDEATEIYKAWPLLKKQLRKRGYLSGKTTAGSAGRPLEDA